MPASQHEELRLAFRKPLKLQTPADLERLCNPRSKQRR